MGDNPQKLHLCLAYRMLHTNCTDSSTLLAVLHSCTALNKGLINFLTFWTSWVLWISWPEFYKLQVSLVSWVSSHSTALKEEKFQYGKEGKGWDGVWGATEETQCLSEDLMRKWQEKKHSLMPECSIWDDGSDTLGFLDPTITSLIEVKYPCWNSQEDCLGQWSPSSSSSLSLALPPLITLH